MDLLRDFMQPGRSAAIGENGMASTSHPAATLTALDVLRAGGNAIDAAIAASALQAVIEPHMTGLGGDCFCLYAPAGGPMTAINGSGRAPAALDIAPLLERRLAAIPEQSPLAVTIPEAVDAWIRLSADHGRLGLNDILQPAIKAAEEGFLVTPRVAADWQRYAPRLSDAARPVYLPGGSAPAAGDRVALPALGRTLRALARNGREAFYGGAVAEELVAVLRASGGPHALEDFASARADDVAPIGAAYRDVVLHECPPNGQGVTALMIARILDGFDLSEGIGEAERVHLFAEATKAAYAYRDRLLADPEFVDVDVERLLSDALIGAIRTGIDRDRAAPATAWNPPLHRDTVSICVVDRDRNAVSIINSIFAGFGSGLYAPASGILLQNRGCGFSLIPGHPNMIAPRKRPLNTIIPGMVSRDGRAVMPFGVVGGQYQAAGHAQILTNMVDRGDNPQAASDRPRSFVVDGRLSLEPTFTAETRERLARRGHDVVLADEPIGGCQAIWIDHAKGVLWGGADHRKDGIALGY